MKITIEVDGQIFEELTVNPHTLETTDQTDDVVALFGRGRQIEGTQNLRDVIEEACRESGLLNEGGN